MPDSEKIRELLLKELAELPHTTAGSGSNPHDSPLVDLSLQPVLDRLTAHIAIMDSNGVILLVNEAWHEFAEANGGKAKNVSEGANYLEVCNNLTLCGSEYPAVKSDVLDNIRCVVKGQLPVFSFEYECSSPDVKRWFRCMFRSLQIGNIYFTISEHTNITAKKRSIELLCNREEKYKMLFNCFPMGITICDKFGLIVESNELAASILGVTKKTHESRRIDAAEWSIIRSDGTPMPAEEYASVRALKENRRIEHVEMGIVNSRGETSWIDVTATPVDIENFNVIVTYNDISENKHRQDALRKSERLFRRTFDQAPIGAAMVSFEYKYIRVNDELCRITGYAEAELIQKGFPEITYPDDLQKDFDHAQKLEAGLIDFYSTDKRYIRSDDEVVWVNVSVRLIRDAAGVPLCYLPMIIDINERKRLEDVLKSKNAELEVGSKELSEMNAALRVLLGQREKDRLALQSQVLANMRLLVLPHLDYIRRETTSTSVLRRLKIIQENFEDITSSFSRTLDDRFRILTSNEIRVADLIRSGMTSKEIADLLHISVPGANYYRKKIRKKLGLSGKKVDLVVYLNDLANNNR